MTLAEETMWFWKATEDTACHHSMVFVSKAHRALTSPGHAFDQEHHQHHALAIQHINRRLASDSKAANDGTIAAIACLAAYEVRPLVQWIWELMSHTES